MRILLSAFACSPGVGSDMAVGWGWAEELAAQGHQVVVITRAENRHRIEQALLHTPMLNLHFEYYDDPGLARVLKRISSRNHLYYYFWQWGAYRLAQFLHDKEKFDVVHHVTWVSIRQPSFMGKLGIPFIFGPVAGGESAPYKLRNGYGLRQWLRDLLRDFANALVKFDPFLKLTFERASRIVVTSEETRQLIHDRYRSKTITRLAIATSPFGSQPDVNNTDLRRASADCMRLLFVGRFLDWKGMHLGLVAMAKLLKQYPDARLTMVGSGMAEQGWRTLAAELGIGDCVEWISWMKQEDLPQLYRSHDVFLFPSLQDSGGLVVLEAMSFGLSVVALDLGGPGSIVDETCGIVVPAKEGSKLDVIEGLSGACKLLAGDESLRQRLSAGALQRVKHFQWSQLVADVYVGL